MRRGEERRGEKDDLEERLMNQLAQLNGSIAGYQQEAADSRERLAELQREVERLEREGAELEALAENERDRAARLEEDKRQAQRERAEAEAGAGKQRRASGERRGGLPRVVCLDKSHCDSGDPRDGEEGTDRKSVV